jgi:hypothetical protein
MTAQEQIDLQVEMANLEYPKRIIAPTMSWRFVLNSLLAIRSSPPQSKTKSTKRKERRHHYG